jgi:hypothetical protein
MATHKLRSRSYKWSGPRPGGLTLRLRDTWGTEVRGVGCGLWARIFLIKFVCARFDKLAAGSWQLAYHMSYVLRAPP